ncbi:MAG: deoxyguanosinetriphosphate triphosphohydrolase [Gammaproteobacteria bacterium]|nr:deoxyguanosinetriphosphate triphosphohydrolase [Gammaproteobacteria bacterium]
MTWQGLLADQRFGKPYTENHQQGRTPFHKDYDRLIFSSAFRRMGHKTQVHSLSHNDHVHNRLTHSLEVASVGRSLGIQVGHSLSGQVDWPEWIEPHDLGAIVQSACLAHDIGNPPFGHFGESSIRHWFASYAQQGGLNQLSAEEQADLLNFEGNAQGLRTLTQLEYHQFNGGMRLTYATLGSFLKYPWLSNSTKCEHKSKFGALQSEKHILADIAGRLGLIQHADFEWCRHPLVYLMEAADDICYAIIDLEDGVELGILDEQDVLELLSPITGPLVVPSRTIMVDAYYSTRRLALLRGKVIDYLVQAAAHAFIVQQSNLLNGALEGDLISHCDPVTQQIIGDAKALAKNRIFLAPERHRTELAAYSVLEKLLDGFVPAALAIDQQRDDIRLSFKAQKHLALMGAHRPDEGASAYQALCCTMDFIGGMTDNYAVDLARQLSGEMK